MFSKVAIIVNAELLLWQNFFRDLKAWCTIMITMTKTAIIICLMLLG